MLGDGGVLCSCCGDCVCQTYAFGRDLSHPYDCPTLERWMQSPLTPDANA